MHDVFVANQNTGRFERLLLICTDADQRQTLEMRLTEARRKRLTGFLPAPWVPPASAGGARSWPLRLTDDGTILFAHRGDRQTSN